MYNILVDDVTYTNVNGWVIHLEHGWIEIVKDKEVIFLNLSNIDSIVVPNTEKDVEDES
jgi:hypothetical protein